MSPRFLAPLLLVLGACGGSADPVSLNDQGYAELGAGDYDAALASFQEALAQLDASDPQYRRGKMGAIEAQMHADADRARDEFLAYAAADDGIGEKDYRAVGGKLTSAGKYAQAVDVLHAAVEKFGKTPDLEKLIAAVEKAATAAGDDAALGKLGSLGYL